MKPNTKLQPRHRIQPQADFMRAAIRAAETGIKAGEGGPFGACVVKDGEIVATGHNTVLHEDATCHAEINAIRAASRRLGTHDLSGCVIYSTTEPCPMCFSAIHWANIDEIVYGTRIRDVRRLGFRELTISNAQMRRLGGAQLGLTAGFLRRECRALLERWKAAGQAIY